MIITILHAIDLAMDNYGEPPNNHAVVAVDGWAFEILSKLFGNDQVGFAMDLESLCPVMLVHKKRLPGLGLADCHNMTLDSKETFYYVRDDIDKYNPKVIERRRKLIWGELMQYGFAEKNLILQKAVKDFIERQIFEFAEGNRTNYVTIHARWMEGKCETRNSLIMKGKDECWMTPSYIKNHWRYHQYANCLHRRRTKSRCIEKFEKR